MAIVNYRMQFISTGSLVVELANNLIRARCMDRHHDPESSALGEEMEGRIDHFISDFNEAATIYKIKKQKTGEYILQDKE